MTPVIVLGGPYGPMWIDEDDDGDTVAFAGNERYVRVEYGVAEGPPDEVML